MRDIKLEHTRVGKPMGKGLLESFTGRLLDGRLNVNEVAGSRSVQPEKFDFLRFRTVRLPG